MVSSTETLKRWAEACQESGLSWYLYKETLLTIHGYHTLPDTVPMVQILAHATDLPQFCETVFPKLPECWELDQKAFATNRRRLRFREEGETVLKIDLLFGVADEEAFLGFAEQLKQTRSMQQHRIKKALGARAKQCRTADAFDQMVTLSATSDDSAPYFTDCLTKKHANLFPAEWFAETETLNCDGTDYPVFSGYRSYLELEFGDFENGLFDAVGVGLSVPEKEELKQHQQKCKEALSFVEQLSQTYGLRYYLLAGSVLGAVRHGGFIPWDDDVDIGIRVEDLKRFEEMVVTNLPEGFTLEQSAPNHPYPRMFSKICYKGRCCIDFWPLVPTYESGPLAKFTWIFGRLITKTHYVKIGHNARKYKNLAKAIGMFMTDRMVMWWARWNERKFQKWNTPAYINLYSIYKREKETIKREWLDTPARARFEDLDVPVVGCTHDYLTHLYGDYMQFPPPWKRASRHSARFGDYDQPNEEEQ